MENEIYKVINLTTKMLYEKDEVYENLDKVEKHVKRLRANFKCESSNKINVFDFNLDKYSVEDNAKFFALWIQILEENSVSGSNRELISNLFKMDWSINMYELFSVFFTQNVNTVSHDVNEVITQLNKLDSSIGDFEEKIMKIIRYSNCACQLKYRKSSEILREIQTEYSSRTLSDKIKLFMLIEKVFTYMFIQTITYEIANNEKVEYQTRIGILQRIKENIDSFDIKENKENSYGICEDFAITIGYLNRKKELVTESSIFEMLNKQIREENYNKYPKDEYKCNGRIIGIIPSKLNQVKKILSNMYYENNKSKKDYSKYTLDECQKELEKVLKANGYKRIESVINIKELKNIITEGNTKEKTVRFKEKLELSWDYCCFLRQYAGRKIRPFYLQHIKNIYREIIIDKIMFNNKTAHTILKNLKERIDGSIVNEEKDWYNQESYYISEKITRGFYRERGTIDIYTCITDIRMIYYRKILEIYKVSDIKEALLYLSNYIKLIDSIMEKKLSEI